MSASPSMQQAMFEDPLERRYWFEIWTKLFDQGVPDSWAYRWALVCMANSALTALPNCNLVMNIGFGDDATHTAGLSMRTQLQGLDGFSKIPVVCRDSIADNYDFDHIFGGQSYRRSLSFLWRLRRRAILLLARPLYYPLKIFRMTAKAF